MKPFLCWKARSMTLIASLSWKGGFHPLSYIMTKIWALLCRCLSKGHRKGTQYSLRCDTGLQPHREERRQHYCHQVWGCWRTNHTMLLRVSILQVGQAWIWLRNCFQGVLCHRITSLNTLVLEDMYIAHEVSAVDIWLPCYSGLTQILWGVEVFPVTLYKAGPNPFTYFFCRSSFPNPVSSNTIKFPGSDGFYAFAVAISDRGLLQNQRPPDLWAA